MIQENFYTFRNLIEKTNNHLTPCEEDYIEMIYRINLTTNLPVRVNDLANKLNVKPPSVTKMIKKLNTKNIIEFKKYKHIYLSNKGLEIGKFLINRHNTVEKFLKLLNADVNYTYETEKIEHTLNNEILSKLNFLVKFFESNDILLKKFHDFYRNY